MDIENIIILAVVIILAFIIIRFVTKLLAKIVAVLIVLGVLFYALFYWDGGIITLGNEDFMLYELEKKYCYEEKDTVKCNCLVSPLIEDIEAQYSPEEIQRIRKNKIRSLKIITTSLGKNREEIRECFRQNKTDKSFNESLKEFIDDIKNKKAKERLEEFLEDENVEEI